ncbi:rubredoxin [Solitalea sp. MAHUQ-68]|uniref:Rubredoxin n=1 Tax=Solitalea agri TaxID=2953739 RepID=A0A9X2JD32_9SPHI|nr:rubredoxin domain-containing protein [Solitalea agri]MCO4294112.1 rubredoxin [Solitalea agri]
MASKKSTVKINLPGGILSAGELKTIVKAAEAAGVKEVQMSVRQQLYLTLPHSRIPDIVAELDNSGLFYEIDFDDYPNIVSSYVTDELFNQPDWLTEGVYADVLDSFDYKPQLKINLVDSTQTLVPFFTGNINFISSTTPHYWHLFIRFPKVSVNYQWEGLVYTDDISKLAKTIELSILDNKELFYEKANANGELLQSMVADKKEFAFRKANEELYLPEFALPYYEGFNGYGKKIWLGIYRRDELFSVEFLKDVCAICLKTKVGRIYTTPWKSIIIKGIEREDQKYWSYILGKHQINVRHASNELNWQVEDLSAEGLTIKKYLSRRFDSIDLKTYGLCFAIKTQPRTGLFGSIVIKKLHNVRKTKTKTSDRFDILYTPNFNANSKNYIGYKSRVLLTDLDEYLAELCRQYYEEKGLFNESAYDFKLEESKTEESEELRKVYQCENCLTVYDEVYGDELNNVAPGTAFDKLADSYCCPTCESSKTAFMLTFI